MFAVVKHDVLIIDIAYSEHATAYGAFLIFVFFNISGDVDLSSTVYLALDRNSQNHTAQGGRAMRVLVYDIESDGTLLSGVQYPAVDKLVTTSEKSQGRIRNFKGRLGP